MAIHIKKHTFTVEIEFNKEVTEQDARRIVDGILDRGYDDLAEQLDEDEAGESEREEFQLFDAILDVKLIAG